MYLPVNQSLKRTALLLNQVSLPKVPWTVCLPAENVA